MTAMIEGFRSIKKPFIIMMLAVLVLGSGLPFVTSSYMLRVLNIAMITYLCVLSVYVLLGMCGQNSFAQAGLWGVGAYITANATLRLGFGSIPAMLAAIAGTALFAFVLGFAFFRLRQYYFTFASIGLMTILNGLFMNWTPVTGGALGISDIPPFRIFGFTADGEIAKFFVIFIVCLLVNVVIRVLFHSPLGRSFMAIRDNELAADCLGVNSLLGGGGAVCVFVRLSQLPDLYLSAVHHVPDHDHAGWNHLAGGGHHRNPVHFLASGMGASSAELHAVHLWNRNHDPDGRSAGRYFGRGEDAL